MIGGLLRSQRGAVAILMALAFMAFGVPVITSALNLASTFSIDSRVKTDILQRQYCALGISEYTRYLVADEGRWNTWWSAHTISLPGVTPMVGQETITLMGCGDITYSIQTAGIPGVAPDLTYQALTATKLVNTPVVSPNAEVEYTITLTNPASSTGPQTVTAIFDGLPPGSSYVAGTTLLNGVPFAEPTQTIPVTDDDLFCIFADNDSLTIAPYDTVPCSIGADGNVTVRDYASIGGKVEALSGSSNVDVDIGATVDGDIRAGGNVTLGQGVTVTGTIRAGGNVTLGQGATVEGNIRAGTGNVTLGPGDNVMGDIVSMSGNVYIWEGADTAGDIWAGGNVELHQNVGVDRNVWSGGNVTLDSDATVGTAEYPGVVLAAGVVTLGEGATIAGGFTENCVDPCVVPPPPPWALWDGEADRSLLTWDLAGQNITLAPGESVTLTFRANASPEGGNFCNQAWGEPGGLGTGTGMTAKLTVGSPATNLCGGEDVLLQTTVDIGVMQSATSATYTYTTTIQNTGSTPLATSMVRSKLPPGFTYVPGSSMYILEPVGLEIPALDPASLDVLGRERLTWYPQPFGFPTLGPGETKTLIFQATAGNEADGTLVRGNYRTESWAFFVEIDDQDAPYSWPTALVQILDPFQITATNADGELGDFQAWLGADSDFFRWTIN